MILGDLSTILYWWLALLGLGILFLPAALVFLSRLWDRGWLSGKTIGLLVLSYLAFLGGRFHLLPFGRQGLVLILVLVAILDLYYLADPTRGKHFWKLLRSNWKRFLLIEILFLLGLTGWSLVRGFQPSIEGLEKFMDFGFVNSILRSKWFPPADIWFAGQGINYYYFGHLQAAVLTKLTAIEPAVTYNLMIGTIFAMTFTGGLVLIASLIASVKKKVSTSRLLMAALAGALLLVLGANLHPLIYNLQTRVFKKPYCDGSLTYWYPNATRFIGYCPDNPKDATIHEFPAYSFVVADLHGHMNNIPTVLLFLSLLLVIGLGLREKKEWTWKEALPGLVISGWLLGLMYMTNSWDFPIYGALLGMFFLFVSRDLIKTLFWGLTVLVSSIVFALPFALSFSPMTEGIKLVEAHSLWWQLLVLWGFFWLLSLLFWIWSVRRRKQLAVADIFVLVATFWATVLIIIPELVYIKDIYIAEYHRANTMFKLVYQSFMIYCLASGYIFWRLKSGLKKPILKIVFLAVFVLGFLAQMIYPYFTLRGYYGGLKEYKGLYGMDFLKNSYPDNYQAVLWFNENVTGQPVVLEAVGDSYTLYNHLSAMTGLPTVEGWLVHEWLWRGGYDQPGKRATDVNDIYQGEDDSRARQLLDQYQVEYVLVGPLEREKYPNLVENRFARMGDLVFHQGEVSVYQISR
ncbi:MAG: DUF2298 domain-containing protein [Patescibacteria group bacterium]